MPVRHHKSTDETPVVHIGGRAVKLAKIGLAFVFVLVFAAAGTPGTYGGSAQISDGDVSAQRLIVTEGSFKLKAGGQIDFAAGTMTLIEQTPGEFAVTMRFVGRLSHANLVSGIGIGTLHMDQDFMFTTEVEGTLQKCLAKYCLG